MTEESLRFSAEFILSGAKRFFPRNKFGVRMTESEGLRMTHKVIS